MGVNLEEELLGMGQWLRRKRWFCERPTELRAGVSSFQFFSFMVRPACTWTRVSLNFERIPFTMTDSCPLRSFLCLTSWFELVWLRTVLKIACSLVLKRQCIPTRQSRDRSANINRDSSHLLRVILILLAAIILRHCSWPLSTIFFILKDLPFFHSNLWFPSQLCHNDSQVFWTLNSRNLFIHKQWWGSKPLLFLLSVSSLSLMSCRVMWCHHSLDYFFH
jgi:hypothetical protein